MDETIQLLTQHGALILFAIVFAEQVGLPFPALPFLVAAGAMVGAGQMAFDAAIGSAFLAGLLGDQVWFELGRWRGRRVLNVVGRISPEFAAGISWTEEFFSRHGWRSLVLAKFVPGVSTIAPTLAGTAGLSVPLFLLYGGLGTAMWVGSGIALGYGFSGELEQGIALARQFGPAAGLALLGIVAGYALYKALPVIKPSMD